MTGAVLPATVFLLIVVAVLALLKHSPATQYLPALGDVAQPGRRRGSGTARGSAPWRGPFRGRTSVERKRLGAPVAGKRDPVAALRADAATLLRQFSALLESGRGESQAWADMRDHWQRTSKAHPFSRICEQVAASEHLGRGTAAGLARCIDERKESTQGQDVALREILQQLLAVTRLSEQTGAPLSKLLMQMAYAMDEAAELRAAVRTAAAGPQLTQVILALVPVGSVLLGELIGADSVAMLFSSGFGLFCLTGGVTMLVLGYLWSRKLIMRVMTCV